MVIHVQALFCVGLLLPNLVPPPDRAGECTNPASGWTRDAAELPLPLLPSSNCEAGNCGNETDPEDDDDQPLSKPIAFIDSTPEGHGKKTILFAGLTSSWPHGTCDPKRDTARAPPSV